MTTDSVARREELMELSHDFADMLDKMDLSFHEIVFMLGAIATYTAAMRDGDVGVVTGNAGFACGTHDFVSGLGKRLGWKVFKPMEDEQ